MATKNYRLYCSVYGCMNSTTRNPELTFFTLPAIFERRLEWLRLICREDLLHKDKHSTYRVCEDHFSAKDKLPNLKRKRLKKNALPLLMLPSESGASPGSFRKQNKETQTVTIRIVNCTQTENTLTERRYTQTSTSLSIHTPQFKKLKDELQQCKKKIKLLQPKKTKKDEEKYFHQLCDKFLNDKLALLVKTQSKLKEHGKGNRYDQDFITYCLNLHHISPKAYQFLQSTFCLPCPSTIYKHSTAPTSKTEQAILPLEVNSQESENGNNDAN